MKDYLIISVVLFVLFVIMGIVFKDYFLDIVRTFIENMANIGEDVTALYLFNNNMRVNLLLILSGIIFSLPSLFIYAINCIVVGFMATVTPLHLYLALIIPHGIFEIPALILSFATSLVVTHLELRLLKGIFFANTSVREQFNLSKPLMIKIITSVVYITILLAIAAVIEAYFTMSLANLFVSV